MDSNFRNLMTNSQKMPVIFVGHGTPMNAIEKNDFTRALRKLGENLPRPEAVLCISAHWLTRGTRVLVSPQPRMIYDMYGFPDELYRIEYSAPGSPQMAIELMNDVKSTEVKADETWGIDHGNWSVMLHLFPRADIPIFQMSIDYHRPMRYHYELAKQLFRLRKRGVLIIGSGNLTHNLNIVDFSGRDAPVREWAREFDFQIKSCLDAGNHDKIINYKQLGKSAELSVPEPSHFIPLIYAIGLQEENEKISYFYDKIEYGTLSMRSFVFGD